MLTKLTHGHHARNVTASNLLNLFLRQLCERISFSAQRFSSVLVISVARIIQFGSKKKMGWICARRVVAAVQNKQLVRYWTDCEHPCDSMRTDIPLRVTTVENAVTVPVSKARPFPAWSKFWNMLWNLAVLIDVAPQPVRNCLRKSLAGEIGRCNFQLHSFTLVDCLPRLRLFVQRAGNFVYSTCAVT